MTKGGGGGDQKEVFPLRAFLKERDSRAFQRALKETIRLEMIRTVCIPRGWAKAKAGLAVVLYL